MNIQKENNPSNTEKLCLDIAKRIGKHNIPAIFIAGDTDNKHSCVVMDSRKEMRDINISVLMDAMLNGEQTGELANVVLSSACILCANIPEWEERFKELLKKFKQGSRPITANEAQA